MAFQGWYAPATCASNMRQRYASEWGRLRSFSVLVSSKWFSNTSLIPTSCFAVSRYLMRLPQNLTIFQCNFQNLTSWPYNWAPGGLFYCNWVCAGYALGPPQGRVQNLYWSSPGPGPDMQGCYFEGYAPGYAPYIYIYMAFPAFSWGCAPGYAPYIYIYMAFHRFLS